SDVRFTTRASAEGKGVEPSSPVWGTALAPRPGQPYPATFRTVEWTRRGVEPRFPVCKTGVFPLDERPMLPVIPDGVRPALPGCDPGVVASGPRDRFRQ